MTIDVAEKRPALKQRLATKRQANYVTGRRDFFKYRDLGVSEATAGRMRAQVMEAISGMTEPTGWHYHVCDTQFIYTLKGWVELEFEDGSKCRLEAGDSMVIPGGLPHNEIGTSDDLEILELSVPGELGTVPCDPPTSRR